MLLIIMYQIFIIRLFYFSIRIVISSSLLRRCIIGSRYAWWSGNIRFIEKTYWERRIRKDVLERRMKKTD